MKKYFLLILSSIFLLALASSCDDALDNLGSDVIGSQFVVGSDTIYINMVQDSVAKMFYNNDTLMLGEFFDKRYGTIKAEALVEVLPDDTLRTILKTNSDSLLWSNPQLDSLVLVLNKTLLNGSANSPLKISVYEKIQTLTIGEKYPTNLPITDYQGRLLAEQWVTGDDEIRIKLPNEDGERLFYEMQNNPEIFKNSAAFREFFKGLYLTTSGGKDLLFNLLDANDGSYLDLRLLYSFQDYEIIKEGARPPANPTLQRSLSFYAFSHYPKAQIIKNTINWDGLNAIDTLKYGYVSSPAGLRPTIKMDLPRINEKLVDYSNLNRAILTLKVVEDEMTALPLPSYLLLIQKNALEGFFENGKFFDGKTSFLGVRRGDQYLFDIVQYIQQKKNDNKMDEIEEMVIVPVSYNANYAYFREKIGLSALCFDKYSIQVDFIYNRLNSRE